VEATLSSIEHGNPGEETRIHAYTKHIKRILRIDATNKLEELGRLLCEKENFMLKSVRINMKKDEFARKGKPPRAVCDLGVTASIRGGWLIGIMKDDMDLVEYNAPYGTVAFVKSPNRVRLRDLFNRLRDCNIGFGHSDDLSGGVKTRQGMLWFNGDFVSCDSTQSKHIFDKTIDLAPERYKPLIDLVIQQCTCPCIVGTVDKLRMKPSTIFEYSGTTLTTICNTLSSVNVLLQIYSVDYSGMSVEEAKLAITYVFRNSGWNIGVQFVNNIEGIQFLKHSPCFTLDGQLEAVTNLGVLLRTLGQKCHDLPGTNATPMWQRALDFQCMLVSGMKHCGIHPITIALRRRYPQHATLQTEYTSNILKETTGSDIGECCPVSLCKRYDMDLQELQQIVYAIETHDWLFWSTGVDKIMQLDYGLGTTE